MTAWGFGKGPAPTPLTGREATRKDRRGQVLCGRYRLERKLGEGGMAEVYVARQQALDRRVAIKLMHVSTGRSKRSWARFEREAKTLAMVRSDHVVQVLDFDRAQDGTPFIAMELLEGVELARLLAQQAPIAPARAAKLVLGACLGLSQAHERGLVHRDLKPSNLFVEQRDGRERVKVLDFGVVKWGPDSTLSREGGLVGTVRYMAPEQARGERFLDCRVDVFSLGCILYECLTGRPAFVGEDADEVLLQVMTQSAPPLRLLAPHVPAPLCEVVERAMQRERAARQASASELAEALQSFLLSPFALGAASASPTGRVDSKLEACDLTRAGSADDSLPVPSSPRRQSRRAGVALGAVFAIFAVALGILASTPQSPATSVVLPLQAKDAAPQSSSAAPHAVVRASDAMLTASQPAASATADEAAVALHGARVRSEIDTQPTKPGSSHAPRENRDRAKSSAPGVGGFRKGRANATRSTQQELARPSQSPRPPSAGARAGSVEPQSRPSVQPSVDPIQLEFAPNPYVSSKPEVQ